MRRLIVLATALWGMLLLGSTYPTDNPSGGGGASSSGSESDCNADPDCYWIEDDDADNDCTDELQEAANSAFGSGASAPASYWRFLTPPGVQCEITSHVRMCEDSDATGATVPDCDGDGELLSSERLHLDLTYMSNVPHANKSEIEESLDAALWIGNATDDGFSIPAVEMTGSVSVYNAAANDALQASPDSEVLVVGLVIERPALLRDFTVSARPATQDEVNANGSGDPKCSLGLNCLPAPGFLGVGIRGSMTAMQPGNVAYPSGDQKFHFAGPFDLALTALSAEGVAQGPLSGSPSESSSAGSAWAGSSYIGRLTLTPQTMMLGTPVASTAVVTVEDFILVNYGTMAFASEPAIFLSPTTSAACQGHRIGGRFISTTGGFNPPVRINTQGTPNNQDCSVWVGATWDATLANVFSGLVGNQNQPQEVDPARVYFKLGSEGSKIVSPVGGGITKSWPHTLAEGKNNAWRALAEHDNDVEVSFLYDGAAPNVAPPIPDDHCSAAPCTLDSYSQTDVANDVISALSMTDAEPDFVSDGVDPGDVVVWLSGDHAGEVNGITAVAANTLTLDPNGSGFDEADADDASAGDEYKVVEPRCADLVSGGWADCGTPSAPNEATTIRHPSGFWTWHRLELRVLDDLAADAACAVLVMKNGSDPGPDGVNSNDYQLASFGTPECDDGADNDGDTDTDYPADADCRNAQDDSEGTENRDLTTDAPALDEATDPAHRETVVVGLDADDFLQIMLIDGPHGTCLDGGSDMGTVQIKGRYYPESTFVLP